MPLPQLASPRSQRRTPDARALLAVLALLLSMLTIAPAAEAATYSPLAAPSVSRVGATTARVAVTPLTGTPAPNEYEVFVRRAGTAVPNFPAEWILILPEQSPADAFAAVTGLQSGVAYEAAVRGVDYQGNVWPLGPWTAFTTTASCNCGLPAPAVRISKLVAGSASELGAATLAWDPPAQPQRLLRYELRYGDFLFDTFAYQYELGGLDPAIEHTVTVTAVDIDGVRSPGTTVRFRTSDVVSCTPPSPQLQNVRVTSVEGQRVSLAWDPVATGGGDPCTAPRPISALAFSGAGITTPAVSGSATSVTLEGLQPANRYDVTIQPIPATGAPDYEKSSAVSFTTPGSFIATGSMYLPTLTTEARPAPLSAAVTLAASGATTRIGDVALTGGRVRLITTGSIPLTADIALIQSRAPVGSVGDDLVIDLYGKLRLKGVYLFGAIPVGVGATCQARSASAIRLTAAGPLAGSTAWQLEGAFSVANFSGCGSLNGIINPALASDGNTITLQRPG